MNHLFSVSTKPAAGHGAPADDPQIEPFTFHRNGDDGALLRPANLKLPHVQKCQSELIAALQSRFEIDPAVFLARFGKEAAKRRRHLNPEEESFQVHPYKLGVLWHFLYRPELAWEPDQGDLDYPGYLEMHPILGEAVMATLAAASAEAEGLQVITEFRELHGKLIGTPREEILNVVLIVPKVTAG
jgi:hypothetical protein